MNGRVRTPARAPRATSPTAAPAMSLHIDRLVLEGLPLPRNAGPRLQAALGAELGRLFAGAALRSDLRAGVALDVLRLDGVTLDATAGAERLGEQLARALFSGLAP
jgi:hypothetical protein